MKLAFAILAHESPTRLIDLIEALVSQGDYVVLHYDANRPDSEFHEFADRFAGSQHVLFAPRVRCGWGEWSLVQAELNCIETIRAAELPIGYVYLMSGADLPTKPLNSLRNFLVSHDGMQFIQSVPRRSREWIIGGLREERFIYRHRFNERRRKRLFKLAWKTQKALGIKRKVPPDLDLSLGSQWWCLSWDACRKILDLCGERPEIVRFFKTTWIPDESFFQTMIRIVVDEALIRSVTLTHYQFNDYGKPVEYFDMHSEFLERDNFFFARKIASCAKGLRQHFRELATSSNPYSLELEQAGIRSGLYEAVRLSRRQPLPWRRAIGVFYDHSIEEFHFPRRPCVVFLGALLSVTRQLPEDLPSLEVHGRLYGPERIEFAKNAEVFGGYMSKDLALRDAAPLAFLSNVLAAAPNMSAFVLTSDDAPMVWRVVRESQHFFPVLLRWERVEDAVIAEITARLGHIIEEWMIEPELVLDCVTASLTREREFAAFIQSRRPSADPLIWEFPAKSDLDEVMRTALGDPRLVEHELMAPLEALKLAPPSTSPATYSRITEILLKRKVPGVRIGKGGQLRWAQSIGAPEFPRTR